MDSEFVMTGKSLFSDTFLSFAVAGSIKQAENSTKDLLLTGDLRGFL